MSLCLQDSVGGAWSNRSRLPPPLRVAPALVVSIPAAHSLPEALAKTSEGVSSKCPSSDLYFLPSVTLHLAVVLKFGECKSRWDLVGSGFIF